MSLRKLQIRKIFISVRSSFWFVPTLLTFGAVALASVLIELDTRFYDTLRDRLPRLLITEPDGAHNMLSAIATSMATVAGVVFSITIVALTLASTQYSPRVLRNFMRDKTNQVVLGVFVGVYIYCLLVLKTISGGSTPFVPSLAVLGGLASAIAAIGFFIFFIHHISTAIQASEIAAAIMRETLAAIDRLLPRAIRECSPPPDGLEYALSEKPWQSIPARETGYIQSVDEEALLSFACKYHTIVRMEYGIGDFVGCGRPLLSIVMEGPLSEDIAKEVGEMFAIGSYRTIEQDIAFGIRQLVDISLKALSPSINDTTTAVACIEHLTVLLSLCAQRCPPQPYHYESGQLRVISRVNSFEDLISLSYRQMLNHAPDNAELITQLFRSLERIIQSTSHPPYLAILAKWADIIETTSKHHIPNPHAEHRIAEHYKKVKLALAACHAPEVSAKC